MSEATQKVAHGSNLTIKATPDESSLFTGWSGDFSGTGDAVLTNITSDKTVTANFTLKTFTVTVNKTGSGSGTLSESAKTVDYGSSLTVKAIPDDCSIFAGWSGDALGLNDAVLTNIRSDKTVTAAFEKKTFTVTINITGDGTGTLSENTKTVECGESLIIKAFPDISSEFKGWSGDFSGTGDAVLSNIRSDKTVTADFSMKTFTITISKAGSGTGTLSESTQKIPYGSSLTIKAIPDISSNFEGWSGDVSGANDAVLTNITSDKTVIATFTLKDALTVTIIKTGNGDGILSESTQTVAYNSSMTVKATPDECSTFAGWSGDAAGTGDAVLTDIISNKTVTAKFEKKTFTVTIVKAGNGNGTLSAETQSADCGGNLTVKATPDETSIFAGWSGDTTGTGDAVLTNIVSDKNLVATFNLTNKPGDISGDGNIDLSDAVIVFKIIAGIDSDQIFNTSADVNNDGKIGMEEIIYILQKIAGMR